VAKLEAENVKAGVKRASSYMAKSAAAGGEEKLLRGMRRYQCRKYVSKCG